MPVRESLSMLALVSLATCCLVGCENEGPLEDAGEKLDNAAEETGEAIEDAGEEIEDAADDAKNKVDG
jgi:hypothetical protein